MKLLNIKLRYIVLFANFLFFFTASISCKTSSKQTTDSDKMGANNSSGDSTGTLVEATPDCGTQRHEFFCKSEEKELQDTQCTIAVYDGKILLDDFKITAWGSSPCDAKFNVKEELCKSNKKAELAVDAICGKSNNVGECPIRLGLCTQEYSPVKCSVKKYDGKELSMNNNTISAWGSNACDGKTKLKEKLCSMGLKPSLALEDIECVSDTSEGECPSKIESCETDFIPSLCKVDLANTNPEIGSLSSYGRSECEAKVNLHNLACIKNLKPSTLGFIDCQKAD